MPAGSWSSRRATRARPSPPFRPVSPPTPAADGLAIAVGAVDAGNQLAGFSNAAGSARDHYLVAPGVNILAPAVGGGAALVSGTSFAAPHVSGAAALVLHAAPFLSAAEVVELLLDSATDLGAPGTDPVFGRGLVNLAAALGPQGPLSVPLGSSVGEADAPLAASALRLGPAFGPGPDLGAAIFLDGYGRPYWLDLGDRVAGAVARSRSAWLAGRSAAAAHPGGATRRWPRTGHGRQRARRRGPAAGPVGAGSRGDAFALELTADDLAGGRPGRLAVSHGFGLQDRFGLSTVEPAVADRLLSEGAFASPYLALAERGDGLVLAQEVADGLAFRVGLVTSEADRQAPLDRAGNTIVIGELARSWRAGHAVGLQLGSVDERQSLLATEAGGALGLPESARTTFLGLTGRLALADWLTLFGQGSLGLTAPGATDQGLLEEVSALRSSSFALGLSGRDLLTESDRLTLAVAQPLRVDGGSAVLDRPVGRTFDGEILRQADRVDLAPDGREIDLELGYRLPLGDRRELGLNWLTQLEPGHRRAQRPRTRSRSGCARRSDEPGASRCGPRCRIVARDRRASSRPALPFAVSALLRDQHLRAAGSPARAVRLLPIDGEAAVSAALGDRLVDQPGRRIEPIHRAAVSVRDRSAPDRAPGRLRWLRPGSRWWGPRPARHGPGGRLRRTGGLRARAAAKRAAQRQPRTDRQPAHADGSLSAGP